MSEVCSRKDISSGLCSDSTLKTPQYQVAEEQQLLGWNEAPHWYQDNEYLVSGYRATSYSYQTSIESIFHIHNETANIFSHLLGSLLFFMLPVPVYYALQPRYHSASIVDVVVFSTFFFGVAVCFLLSTIFHTFSNHSERVHTFASRLDYLGIVILMWGSTIPCVYYGFFRNPVLQTTYFSFVLILALMCIYTTLNPFFGRPQYRHYRILMYIGLGFSFIVPIIHGVIKFGWETQVWRMSLDWMALMTFFNLTGATLYAFKIPERWYPNRFDIWGSSHQFMHHLVVCAGVAHLCGLLRAFDHIHGQLDALEGNQWQ